MIRGPRRRGGWWLWGDSAAGGLEVRFVGRGPAGDGGRAAALAAAGGGDVELAWVRQVHSAEVQDAGPGDRGAGDALVGGAAGLALSVVTADCVPVLLASAGSLAAVHAGWRGVVAGVVPAAVERLAAASGAGDPAGWRAWVGPAIGGCCYEVGAEVAERVAAVSTGDAVLPGPEGRPHLDLMVAVVAQLVAGGVGVVRPMLRCTRCEPDLLHSYRRDGRRAGRNHAFIWRRR